MAEPSPRVSETNIQVNDSPNYVLAPVSLHPTYYAHVWNFIIVLAALLVIGATVLFSMSGTHCYNEAGGYRYRCRDPTVWTIAWTLMSIGIFLLLVSCFYYFIIVVFSIAMDRIDW